MASLLNDTRPSMSPDVTVVVGMQEFQEHSRELCCWSDYFHAAFRSGMEETRSMRFEFNDRDPEEWKLIRSLAQPFPTARVNMDNVAVALSWFDELRCEQGLKECDRILNATVLSIIHPQKSTSRDKESMKENVDHFLETLSTSIQYGLASSKESSIACLVRVINEVPPQELTEDRLKTIFTCMEHDDHCGSVLWESLSRHVPTSLAHMEKESLIRNECLPALIAARIEKDVRANQLGRLFQICDIGLSPSSRRQIREDTILRDAVPSDWYV